MLKIGLTGSIGMGKSATAKLFADAGLPVNDADAVVHDLYSGAAAPLIDVAFPGSVKGWRSIVRNWAGSLHRVPKVSSNWSGSFIPACPRTRKLFLDEQRGQGTPMVLLDIPLLFESGALIGSMSSSSSAVIHRFSGSGYLRVEHDGEIQYDSLAPDTRCRESAGARIM